MVLESRMETIALDITEATNNLFETMIMMDLKSAEATLVDDTQIKTDVIGMVSFTGKYHGIIALFCSKSFALKAASTMLMTKLTEFTTDVKDTVTGPGPGLPCWRVSPGRARATPTASRKARRTATGCAP